ncbi:alpha/beta fold hydrolase [Mycobacterium sp. NPDC051198]
MTATTPVELSSPFAPNPVIAKGNGTPVVFLHGPHGQDWPGFLDDLAEQHRVFAPANPGIEEPADLDHLDDIYDLVVYYDELFENLGVEAPFDLVGHSYGGMIAAEYAAVHPEKVRRLVLIDSMGLWDDSAPVNDFITAAPEQVISQIWLDFSKPEVKQRATPKEDLAEAQAQMINMFAAVASAAHFTAPIPERGLRKRLRRIKAPTLVVWGAEDLLVPVAYAELFRSQIANAEVEVVAAARHYPHIEQREAVTRRVLDFLG